MSLVTVLPRSSASAIEPLSTRLSVAPPEGLGRVAVTGPCDTRHDLRHCVKQMPGFRRVWICLGVLFRPKCGQEILVLLSMKAPILSMSINGSRRSS